MLQDLHWRWPSRLASRLRKLMHEAVECKFLNDLMVWQMALCSKIWFSLTSFCRTYLQFEVAKNWQTFCKSTRQGSPFEQLQGGGPLTKGKGPMFNSRLFLSTKGVGLTSSFTFRAPNTELQSTCRRTSNNLDGLKVSARCESSKVFFHGFGIQGYFPRYVSPRQKHPMTGTNICKHLYKDCSALLISSVVVLIQFFFQSWHWVLGLKTESSFSQSPLTEEIPNLLRFEIRFPQP